MVKHLAHIHKALGLVPVTEGENRTHICKVANMQNLQVYCPRQELIQVIKVQCV